MRRRRRDRGGGLAEDIVKVKRSYTGAFLKPVLERRAERKRRMTAAE